MYTPHVSCGILSNCFGGTELLMCYCAGEANYVLSKLETTR